jgi:hypothetical protein
MGYCRRNDIAILPWSHHPWREDLYLMVLHRPVEPAAVIGRVEAVRTLPVCTKLGV